MISGLPAEQCHHHRTSQRPAAYQNPDMRDNWAIGKKKKAYARPHPCPCTSIERLEKKPKRAACAGELTGLLQARSSQRCTIYISISIQGTTCSALALRCRSHVFSARAALASRYIPPRYQPGARRRGEWGWLGCQGAGSNHDDDGKKKRKKKKKKKKKKKEKKKERKRNKKENTEKRKKRKN